MALHAQNNTVKTTEALDVLTRAAEKDPANPQVIVLYFGPCVLFHCVRFLLLCMSTTAD